MRLGIGPGAAAEEGRNADGATRDATSGGGSASDRGPADDNRALGRSLAHDDRASRRGLAGDRNGGRGAGSGGSDQAGIGGARNDGRGNFRVVEFPSRNNPGPNKVPRLSPGLVVQERPKFS